MRHLATLLTVLVFLLTGCAKDLPYAFSIYPSNSTKGCAVSLHHVVEETLKELRKDSAADVWSVRRTQRVFEKTLGDGVQKLDCAKLQRLVDSSDQSVEPVESVSSKWLVTYAFEPTDSDHSMERFIEFLLSMRVVQTMTETEEPIKADVKQDLDPLFEASKDKKAQWFGEREGDPKEDCPSCATFVQGVNQLIPQLSRKQPSESAQAVGEGTKDCPDCALYKIVTDPDELYRQKDYQGKDPSDPSQAGKLLTLARRIVADKDRSRRIVVLGYEIPWDEDQTLIRYGVTFYFEDRDDGAQPNGHVTRYLGYDLVYANEATPAPYEPKQIGSDKKPLPIINNRSIGWRTRIWNNTGYPISVVIGIKNAAFELAKMPFSFVAGALFGRDSAVQYPLQNIRTAYNAIRFEVTTETRMNVFLGLYRLFTETPLVGHLFQYNFGAEAPVGDRPDMKAPLRNKIFLSRGIYGGNKWGQDTGLWAALAHKDYPTYDVYSPPYRHGTVTDVVWSMFNLSHGPAYSEALYIKDHAGTADRVYLAGHSGGVQRSATASRILWYHGYSVKKVVGIAGPSVGQAFVDVRYPDAFRVYLNNQTGANQDVVSQVGTVAQAFSSTVSFVLRVPLVYVPKILCPEFIFENCSKKISVYMDQVGPSNARVFEVERKPSSLHNTPLRQSLTDRIVFDAFIRNEFATAFRDDLESPSDSKEEREAHHAIPWEP